MQILSRVSLINAGANSPNSKQLRIHVIGHTINISHGAKSRRAVVVIIVVVVVIVL